MQKQKRKLSDVSKGIIIGFIIGAIISFYLSASIVSIPLSLLYGIISPMISAIAIIVIMSSRKEKRKQLFDARYMELHDEELSEKRKKLRSSYIVK